MPRGDGTGSTGGTPVPGRGGGPGGRPGAGPGGKCVCPGCGRALPHERGVPCSEKRCPACGLPMTRQG